MDNKNFILIFVAVVFLVGAIFYINNPEPIEYKIDNTNSVSTSSVQVTP